MNKEVVSKKQMRLFMFTYSIGSYLLFGMGAKVNQNAWISSTIATICSIPIVMMYGKTMSLYHNKNIFEILELTFGKVIGKVLTILVVLQAFFLGGYILNDFADFIKVTALFQTPIVVTMMCIGFLSIWILKSGIEVLAAWAQFFIRIILVFMVLIWILLIPEMHIINLLPIFPINMKQILNDSIYLITFPFTEVVIFMNFFDTINEKENVKNVFVKPLVISGILCIIISVINILVLGGNEYASFYYPGYEVIKRLKLQQEFQRVEIIVSLAFTIIQFLEINLCILGVTKGVQSIFKLKNYKSMITPIVILLISFSYIIFDSVMEAERFTITLWPVYGIIFQIILPAIIFVVALIREKYIYNFNIHK